MLVSVIIIIVVAAGGYLYLQSPKFGKLPSGKDLTAIQQSPHYRNGEFKNLIDTPMFTTDQSFLSVLYQNMTTTVERLQPEQAIPSVKTDLKAIPANQDVVVWLGHSSFYIQLNGKRILLDPVFSDHASPVSFAVPAFKGTNIYQASDIPDLDALLISHDHWDHLDYPTVMALKDKTARVITALGTGAYFRHWGFSADKVHEGDWYDVFELGQNTRIHLVPARHYSGRLLKRNQTLWTGFVVESPQQRLLFGGDSGYGPHFAEIGQRFGQFDWVTLDSGQYDKRWAYIHMTPEEALQAAEDLNARQFMPCHIGRFALARHAWDEPFQRVATARKKQDIELLTPEIGQPVMLSASSSQSFTDWWKN
ncbi:MAG: MBL fold metallo-hydrolase [Oceanospirillaceae bacterium]|nr:MBL fold metallo-hydrolase [Oceanospirillaceae bacterium]MBT13936.1 MBL fold metallo-hydrolase [Oceanospirillaceae bacterium]|tara:strand:+ start:24002 stop:25096 length:1095 start_codon:yes stop_codon:yes gene_type:complete